MNKGLGRLYQPDERDNKFLLRKMVPDKARPKSKQWACNWAGDQKKQPWCVGFSWHALLRSKPVLQRKPVPLEICTVSIQDEHAVFAFRIQVFVLGIDFVEGMNFVLQGCHVRSFLFCG